MFQNPVGRSILLPLGLMGLIDPGFLVIDHTRKNIRREYTLKNARLYNKKNYLLAKCGGILI